MNIGLFAGCHTLEHHPRIADAAADLLEHLGIVIERRLLPPATCCGRREDECGLRKAANDAAGRFVEVFNGCEWVVATDTSCVAHVRPALYRMLDSSEAARLRGRTVDVVTFIHDVLRVSEIPWSRFEGNVVMPYACDIACPREETPRGIRGPWRAKAITLLNSIPTVRVVDFQQRQDDCCGFGWIANRREPENAHASADRLFQRLCDSGADCIVSAESTCVDQLAASARRHASTIRCVHILDLLWQVPSLDDAST